MADADTLIASIEIAAPPSTVYRYFSDPSRFRTWMGEGSEISLEPGGTIVVRYPSGEIASGRVEAYEADQRVVFTWGYEDAAHGLSAGASRVDIELASTPSGTLVTLRHSRLDVRQRREHEMGWRFALAALSRVATAEQLAGVAEARIADYLSAWSESDAVKRVALLERCWRPDATFRDAMGFVTGVGALDSHIAGAQRFAPGLRLERAGELSQAHAHACYRWRAVGPDGQTMMTGTNVCEFAADGRLMSVVGFWDGVR